MSKLKLETISFIKTFLATFLSILGVTIMQLPTEQLMNPETYKASFIVGIVIGAVRSALSISWQKVMPVSVGGVKKK
jgi:hypothetical protein